MWKSNYCDIVSCGTKPELWLFSERGATVDTLMISIGSSRSRNILDHRDACTAGSFGRDFAMTAQGTRDSVSARGRIVEELWREFLSDPSQWWDHRSEKINPRYPDFKHKKTQQSLWLIDKLNPPWVETELAAIRPGILQPNIFSWNKRLERYVKAGEFLKALGLFQQMQRAALKLNSYSFVPVLSACSSLQALEQGRCIHSQVIKDGCELDVYVGSSLVDMYAKCGSIDDARRVFDKMHIHNVVSWSSMILGYVKCGDGQKALDLFQKMQEEGVTPNTVTFVGALNACASVAALEEGRLVHGLILQSSCESNIFVGNSLIDMYAKCGSMEDAWRVFKKMPARNLVSWSTMILGYAKYGQGQIALELSQQMQQDGIDPDPGIFVGMLNACASVAAIEQGRIVHKQIVERGFEFDVFVCNSLIDMYAKCRSMDDAWKVFINMPICNVVACNAMIVAYVKCGDGQKALEIYRRMQCEAVEPDMASFLGLLNACSGVAALEEGRHIHEQILQRGWESDVFVSSSLIDMYGKCGSMEDALRMFNMIPKRGVVVWTAMIAGYALHGHAKEALKLHEQMCREDVQMDGVTFLSLLSACNHGGLVDEGLHYFESMVLACNISPTIELYACLIDLLGRAGRLHEARDLIKKMPSEPNATVWRSLLGACNIHGNVEMGERIAKEIVELNPADTACYLLLSNIYAAADNWDDTAGVT